MSAASRGDAIPAARDLTLALDHLSEACIALDLDQMLSAEAGMAVALGHLRSLAPPTDPSALTREIDALRRALRRAERLGASFDDLLRASAGVMTPAELYDRDGRERAASREGALEARG